MTRALIASAALLCLAAAPPLADDGAVAKERLRALLSDIIARQKQVGDALPRLPHPPYVPVRDPVLGASDPIALAKGETKKVRHTVQWNLFDKDELAVKVAASDPTITVPAELKLDFEKNQFRFEYAVKAGDKAGAYTVTLTPEVGRPVVVKVIVK